MLRDLLRREGHTIRAQAVQDPDDPNGDRGGVSQTPAPASGHLPPAAAVYPYLFHHVAIARRITSGRRISPIVRPANEARLFGVEFCLGHCMECVARSRWVRAITTLPSPLRVKE